MTRDELREKVARAILIKRFFEADRHNYVDVDEFWDLLDGDHKYDASNEADAAIDTIFAALKEPTDEMKLVHQGDRWFGTPQEDWQAMLSASPLAPREEEK